MQGTLHLLIVGLLLTGCAKVTSDACPRLVAYSADEQRQAADEIAGLEKGSMLVKMIADYGVVRQEIRICLGR